jgi:hypothetical protein
MLRGHIKGEEVIGPILKPKRTLEISINQEALIIMNTFNLKEVTMILHSYGFKCDTEMVSRWISEGNIKGWKRWSI